MLKATFKIVSGSGTWENIAGSPYDNTALAAILNSKADNSTVESLSETVDNNYNTLDSKIDTHIADKSNPHEVTKTQVGLGNVDNTSDLNKPISTATQTALDGKVPTSRTINSKALTSDITLDYSDVGALSVETTINDLTDSEQQAALNSGATTTNIGQITTNANDISDIQNLIPNTATSSNQLADKQYVNSAIQTNSAHFRGNWATWAAVPTDVNDYPADDDGNKTPTTNDYMVVQNASDYTGETLEGAWQFTYTGLWTTNGKSGWQPRFQVNESPLTPAQQTALDSGITPSLVSQITTNQTNITGLQTSKQDTISDLSTIRSNATNGQSAYTTIQGYGNIVTHNVSEFATAAQGAKADTAVQPADIANMQTTTNLVTSVSSSSTDSQYPSAKLFYDTCGDIETLINAL